MVQSPVGARDSSLVYSVRIVSGTHLVSCWIGAVDSFSEVKRSVRESDPSAHPVARLRRVHLCPHTPPVFVARRGTAPSDLSLMKQPSLLTGQNTWVSTGNSGLSGLRNWSVTVIATGASWLALNSLLIF